MNPKRKKLSLFPKPCYSRIRSNSKLKMVSQLPLWVGPSFGRKHIQKIQEEYRRVFSCKPNRKGESSNGKSCIKIGNVSDGEEFASLNHRYESKLPNGKLGEEGFILSASPGGIRIVVGGISGVLYALQILKQVMSKRGKINYLPSMEVADAPAYPFRGIHITNAGPGNLKELERFIQEVLPFYRVNTLILSVGYGFRFKSHPEIKAKNPYNKTQARKLVRLCRENNIHLIPLVNCLGHQSWRTKNIGALFQAYPEFNETPGAENPKYCYNWCPSNPKVYKVVNDLLDEIIDAFESDTIHLGMDEVFDLGVCPRCRGKKSGDLFAKAINDLYRHVTKKRKTKMMIWADRLIDGKKTPYNEMNSAFNGTHTAMSQIPNDIFLCDWHYHLHNSYPSVQRFNRAGFDYVSCSYKKHYAVDAFLAYAAKNGGGRYQGHLDTNWGGQPVMKELLDRKKKLSPDAVTFVRGMELAWRGADNIKAPRKENEHHYKNRPPKNEVELY